MAAAAPLRPPAALALCAAAAAAMLGAEAKGCGPKQLRHSSGLSSHELRVGDDQRRYLLYVPSYYQAEQPVPLWILAPGAYNEPEKQIDMSEMVRYAEEQQFAFLALKGDKNLMNVVLKGRSVPERPDDVAYTRAALDDARGQLCIDARRIFCTGYSRGARFCSRLASELSGTIAAIAPVSGIRFPEPNNATRPMPIMAFHGTNDPINPYPGHGNPEYWDDSVQTAIAKWANFNGCSRNESYRLAEGIAVQKHTGCDQNADVVLVRISGGGHTWPGSMFPWSKGLGVVTHEINASVIMGRFFAVHGMADEHAGEKDTNRGSANTPLVVVMAVVAAVLAATLFLQALCCRPSACGRRKQAWEDTESDENGSSESESTEFRSG